MNNDIFLYITAFSLIIGVTIINENVKMVHVNEL